MRKTRFVFVALTLAGCTVGPDYKKPEVTMPDTWNTSNSLIKTADVNVQNTAWWQHFNDPILNQLINEAAASNLDVSTALVRVREARAALSLSQADILPSITTAANMNKNYYGSQAISSTTKVAAGTTTGLSFDANWEIDIFGRLARANESAEATMNAAVEDGRAIIVSLLGEVAMNYINLRNYQQQLAMQQAVAKAWKTYGELRLKLDQTGLITYMDELSAEVSYNQALVEIPQLEALVHTTLNQLCLLLGRTPGMLDDMLQQSGDIPDMNNTVLANLPGNTIAQRPDVRKAEQDLHSAHANIGVAEGNLYPQFSLTGALGWGSSNGNNLIGSRHSIASTGIGAMFPIFDFGKIRSQIDVQYAKRDEAFIAFKKVILLALQDVENALINWRSETQRLATFKKTYEANKLAYELTKDREKNGLNNTLDVMQMELGYLLSKQNYASSIATHAITIVNVYKALGGGWNTVTVGAIDQKQNVEKINLMQPVP